MTIRNRLVAAAAAIALALGVGVVTAVPANAASATCKSIMTTYEREYQPTRLSSNVGLCKVADTKIGWALTKNMSATTGYVRSNNQKAARDRMARDWAAVIATTPKNYQANLLTQVEAGLSGRITYTKVDLNYRLMFNYVAYLKYKGDQVDKIYTTYERLGRVVAPASKATPFPKLTRFYFDVLLKSKGTAIGVLKIANAKKLSLYAPNLPR